METHQADGRKERPMIIILQVNAPPFMAQAVKESLAMYMERFGDTKVLEVRLEERTNEQMKIGSVRNE